MYTRRGDRGETSLYGPRRVRKDSPRVEAYGTIDELNSLIGTVVAETKEKKVAADLRRIQKMLFVAGADSASDIGRPANVPRISAADTAKLEEMTDELLKELPRLQNFVLPGGTPVAARLQFARAVCRRAERRIVTASAKEAMNEELLPFFNRLSSYLFNLARRTNLEAGVREDLWKA
jgi:cob(I)alamin adenosyltransferase